MNTHYRVKLVLSHAEFETNGNSLRYLTCIGGTHVEADNPIAISFVG